jgi:hypothetical protein
VAERLITDSSLARATATSYLRAQGKLTRETETSFRAAGCFDAADMMRQFADQLERGELLGDNSWADRGRTTAFLQLKDALPEGLTFYSEAGQELTVEEAMRLGGWAPKRRAEVPRG